MITHGCLLVSDHHNRRVMLHTYHSGYAIPDLPPLAFDALAKYYSYLSDDDAKEVLKNVSDAAVYDRAYYASSAASLLIAARPCFLEIVTVGVRHDLPDWSGIKKPYRLKILARGEWQMFSPEGGRIGQYEIVTQLAHRLTRSELAS